MDRVEEQTITNVSWEELGISNDFMFGKVMHQPELCRELLQRILLDLEAHRIP